MGLSNEGCAQDCWVFHACRLTRALHGSKAQGKQKCPKDNLEATQGSRKSIERVHSPDNVKSSQCFKVI